MGTNTELSAVQADLPEHFAAQLLSVFPIGKPLYKVTTLEIYGAQIHIEVLVPQL